MSDRETLAADMQQAFHHWSTKRGEVFEVMADIALSAIADETQHLRAELAAEKEWAAGIAENFRESWPYGRLIAAAIRASNAAPLERLPGGLARHWLSEGGTSAPNAAPPQPEDFTSPRQKGELIFTPDEVKGSYVLARDQAGERYDTRRDYWLTLPFAAPPHVEPSAAESDRELERDVSAALSWVDETNQRDAVLALIAKYRHPATEARMVELAREQGCGDPHCKNARCKLAALVIETFGKDSQ